MTSGPLDYDLPRELIAQQPLPNRADARLMVVDRATRGLAHHHVRDLPQLLRAGDRLVVNDTRVLPAQLVGRREKTGGAWRGLFLSAEPTGHWRIVCKTRGRLAEGEAVVLLDAEGRQADRLTLVSRLDQGVWLAKPEGGDPAHEALERLGRVPLPPYIRGGRMVDADRANYQTVYARRPGAVAAPTAGLHLTRELLARIASQGVEFSAVTLHVGLGTFRPITGPVEQHQMHSEEATLGEPAANEVNATRAAGGRVVAVGTTTVRALESAAAQQGITSRQQPLAAWRGDTDLFIRPPYEFRVVDALLTNFHFPATTLLLMVQALAGDDLIREAYAEAVRERYRFYSYGDAMLIV